jgi:hypothetical protein
MGLPQYGFNGATNCAKEEECEIVDGMFNKKPPIIRMYFNKAFFPAKEYVLLEWKFNVHIFSRKTNKFIFRRRFVFHWKFKSFFISNVKNTLTSIDVKLTETPIPWYTEEEMEERKKQWELSQKALRDESTKFN